MKLAGETEGLWGMKVCSTGGLGEIQKMLLRALKRPAGGNVYGWKVVSRGYWADGSESSCGKRSPVMMATGGKCF